MRVLVLPKDIFGQIFCLEQASSDGTLSQPRLHKTLYTLRWKKSSQRIPTNGTIHLREVIDFKA
jgi:hypothetical protein